MVDLLRRERLDFFLLLFLALGRLLRRLWAAASLSTTGQTKPKQIRKTSRRIKKEYLLIGHIPSQNFSTRAGPAPGVGLESYPYYALIFAWQADREATADPFAAKTAAKFLTDSANKIKEGGKRAQGVVRWATMLEANLIQENIPLAPLTTLGVGGAARYFAEISDERELPVALAFARRQRLPVFLLGGGSNLVVADEGFDGLVVRVALRGVEDRVEGDTAWVTVAAGEEWDAIVGHCVGRTWAGFECLSGIPGSVGGTPVQNVGAYGQEVSETIVTVRAYDRRAEQVVELSNAECQFSYRRSLFNTVARERYVVLRVTYLLRVAGAPALRYADVQKHFADASSAPTLAAVREAVLAIRRRKAMVIDPADPDTRSAGSFFKNPILAPEQFAALETSARVAGLVKVSETIPRYVAEGGQIKIPAAWLIERAGFAKGYTRGRVGLSNKHTLALVNRGGASAGEVMELMREIQRRVQERFGVWLAPEPVLVGFKGGEVK